MIAYHGTPITPDKNAVYVLSRRHALVPFSYPSQTKLCASVCQSFVIDNGAFSAFKIGKVIDRKAYYDYVEEWRNHPAFDWAVIPDVIGGTDAENDAALKDWPFGPHVGLPVWHIHSKISRLKHLATNYPRIGIGGSGGEYSIIGGPKWWGKLLLAMDSICDSRGYPVCKLHGFRMLKPEIVRNVPLASGDSTNIARSIKFDSRWPDGNNAPPTNAIRGYVLAERIEHMECAMQWDRARTEKRLAKMGELQTFARLL